jgi:hypothetical protein
VEKATANCGMHNEQRTAAKNKDCRELPLHASLEASWDRRFLVLVGRRWSLLIIVLELCCAV